MMIFFFIRFRVEQRQPIQILPKQLTLMPTGSVVGSGTLPLLKQLQCLFVVSVFFGFVYFCMCSPVKRRFYKFKGVENNDWGAANIEGKYVAIPFKTNTLAN